MACRWWIKEKEGIQVQYPEVLRMQPGLVWIHVHRLLPSGNVRQGKSQSMCVYCHWCHSDQVCSLVSVWRTTSKAFEKSKIPMSTWMLLSWMKAMSWTVDKSWVSQLCLLRNPCWKGESIGWESRSDDVLYDLGCNTGKANVHACSFLRRI